MLTQAAAWMDLKAMVLSKISHLQEDDILYDSACPRRLEAAQFVATGNRMGAAGAGEGRQGQLGLKEDRVSVL